MSVPAPVPEVPAERTTHPTLDAVPTTPPPPGPPDDTTTRRLLLYVGAALLAGGVPVHEVEDDVREVARALGHPGVEVSAFPTTIVLALAPGAASSVESVRGPLRLDQTAEANAITAGLREHRLDPDTALQRLSVLRRRPNRYAWRGFHAGHVLVAAGISLVLQPTVEALVLSVAMSPVVSGLMRLAGRSRLLSTLLPLVAAGLVALAAFAAASAGWLQVPLRSLLAPLAVLFPGALIVTGLSELSAGAMVAGSARLAYGTAQLLLFSLGVAGAAVALRVPPDALLNTRVDELGPVAPFLGVVLLTAGIALMESVPPGLVPWVLVVVLATYGAQALGGVLVAAAWFGAFLGGATAALGSALAETARPSLPRIVVFLPSFWLLVPGSLGMVSLTQLGLEPELAGSSIAVSTSVVCAVAIGIVVGSAVARSLRRVVRRAVRTVRRLPSAR